MEIRWLGKACIEIVADKNILIDPDYVVVPKNDPDIILVTHEHDDHFNPELIKDFETATLYAPQSVYDEFSIDGEVVHAGEEIDPGIKVLDCDCYGAEESVSYYYDGLLHTADASEFPEPKEEVDIVFSACFPDFYDEYIKSCEKVGPEVVIPYHYTPGEESGEKEAEGLIEELKTAGFKAYQINAGEKIKL